jgi:hypothetical protein
MGWLWPRTERPLWSTRGQQADVPTTMTNGSKRPKADLRSGLLHLLGLWSAFCTVQKSDFARIRRSERYGGGR